MDQRFFSNFAPTAVPLWRSSRFTLAVMAFLAFLNFYSLRVNISFAIVCMVNDTAVSLFSVDNTNETASQKAMLNITYKSLLDGRNSSELGSYGFESSINSSYDMRQEVTGNDKQNERISYCNSYIMCTFVSFLPNPPTPSKVVVYSLTNLPLLDHCF